MLNRNLNVDIGRILRYDVNRIAAHPVLLVVYKAVLLFAATALIVGLGADLLSNGRGLTDDQARLVIFPTVAVAVWHGACTRFSCRWDCSMCSRADKR